MLPEPAAGCLISFSAAPESQPPLRLMALALLIGGISVMVTAYFQAVGSAREALMITLGGIVLVKLPVLLLVANLFSLT